MQTLSIDIETYSSVNLKKAGVYAYASAPDFQILMVAYAFNDDPVQIADLIHEPWPTKLLNALKGSTVLKHAYNANFERTCISKALNMPLPPEQWRCTAVHANMMGLPGKLEDVAKALNLPQDQQKMKEGKRLIAYFSTPCKPTKKNGRRTRNLPEHDPEKWELFKQYCMQDVEVERALRKKLTGYIIPQSEQILWEMDQKINDNGVGVDVILIDNALACDAMKTVSLESEFKHLTGLANPNSTAQLKGWLEARLGEPVESINKAAVKELLQTTTDKTVHTVLKLRQEMAKTSVKKYEAAKRGVCPDNRIRGLLQFYGANRTGRWAGRLVQVQNLPRNYLPDLDLARSLIREGRYDHVELLFGSTSDTLSQLIRTMFIPTKGHTFMIADFSAIEARVLAWLSGEAWRMEVFRTHGKVYEASASQMFGVPMWEITKDSPLRQKGKVAELALGYHGGPRALIAMGALDMGLTEKELPQIVAAWRRSNPQIVRYWHRVGYAAIKAVKEGCKTCVGHVTFRSTGEALFIELPSGRRLSYYQPKLGKDPRYDTTQLTYAGVDQQTKRWGRISTYSGKLVENIVQGVARDCLAVAMMRLDAAGYKIVMHVHDEVILDVPQEKKDALQEVSAIMAQDIGWAPGLPLRADAFQSEYYQKG